MVSPHSVGGSRRATACRSHRCWQTRGEIQQLGQVGFPHRCSWAGAHHCGVRAAEGMRTRERCCCGGARPHIHSACPPFGAVPATTAPPSPSPHPEAPQEHIHVPTETPGCPTLMTSDIPLRGGRPPRRAALPPFTVRLGEDRSGPTGWGPLGPPCRVTRRLLGPSSSPRGPAAGSRQAEPGCDSRCHPRQANTMTNG